MGLPALTVLQIHYGSHVYIEDTTSAVFEAEPL